MKPLREHYTQPTDQGDMLNVFDYIEALEKHIEEMKLYAFQPQGHGEQSFFTIAKSEEEAIKAVNKHIEKVYPKGSPNEYDAYGFGTDYYEMTVVEEGQVVENNNQ
jgi:hypothetical protein